MSQRSLVAPFSDTELEAIRADFPALALKVRGQNLAYLDNAATTQKPASVIEAEAAFYRSQNANVHRGVHYLSQIATELFEDARETVRRFLNAKSRREIVFTKGCTESINLVAHSWGATFLKPGDEIVLTQLEHHSNIVPWQLIAQRTGAVLRVWDIDDNCDLTQGGLDALLSERTKIVALTHIANGTGTINPIKQVIAQCHAAGAKVLIDGAQAAARTPLDMQLIDADFYALSAHKLYGPTGVGVLYTRESVLEQMPPYQGGGDMIRTVSFDRTTYNDLPYRFEAGTPNVAGVVAFKQAIEYVQRLGLDRIFAHEKELADFVVRSLEAQPDVKTIGNPKNRAGIVAFLIECAHPHDVATILDSLGVAVRSGHHCNMPLMKRLGINGTTRASFAVYNTKSEVERLIEGLKKVREIFQ
jgi:cysteine desulfurase/selenocysteine lyase